MGRLRTPVLGLIAAVATGAAVLLITSSGDDGNSTPAPPPRPAPRRAKPPPPPPDRHAHRGEGSQAAGTREQVHRAVAESPRARLDAGQRRVVRVVRSYVTALDSRSGPRVCDLFMRGALGAVRFPRDRGTCARSLSASIGYRDPRGFPVFRSSRVARVGGVAIDGQSARVTATLVTRFAGDRQPSVEDDIIYLRREGARWLIAKPGAVLYRAIGVGNVPPAALAPP